MYSVSSKGVAKAIQLVTLKPQGQYFEFVIPARTIYRSSGSSGKTLVLGLYIYDAYPSFEIEVNWGTLDGFLQEMSGEGRVGLLLLNENTTYEHRGNYRYIAVAISIPAGSDYFSIATSVNLGVSDMHFE